MAAQEKVDPGSCLHRGVNDALGHDAPYMLNLAGTVLRFNNAETGDSKQSTSSMQVVQCEERSRVKGQQASATSSSRSSP